MSRTKSVSMPPAETPLPSACVSSVLGFFRTNWACVLSRAHWSCGAEPRSRQCAAFLMSEETPRSNVGQPRSLYVLSSVHSAGGFVSSKLTVPACPYHSSIRARARPNASASCRLRLPLVQERHMPQDAPASTLSHGASWKRDQKSTNIQKSASSTLQQPLCLTRSDRYHSRYCARSANSRPRWSGCCGFSVHAGGGASQYATLA